MLIIFKNPVPLIESTPYHQYKDKFVNFVRGNYRCLFLESYEMYELFAQNGKILKATANSMCSHH
jgi:hypothetical protein